MRYLTCSRIPGWFGSYLKQQWASLIINDVCGKITFCVLGVNNKSHTRKEPAGMPHRAPKRHNVTVFEWVTLFFNLPWSQGMKSTELSWSASLWCYAGIWLDSAENTSHDEIDQAMLDIKFGKQWQKTCGVVVVEEWVHGQRWWQPRFAKGARTLCRSPKNLLGWVFLFDFMSSFWSACKLSLA